MHIVFINYDDFGGCSGIHIHPLANEFCSMGHRVTVLIPNGAGSCGGFTDYPQYNIRDYNDSRRLLHEKDILFVSWTPRELVRRKTLSLTKEYQAPFFVHLEDNEERIVSDFLGLPFSELQKMNVKDLDNQIPLIFSDPKRYKEFLAQARGVTCIIETLEEFVPKSVPAMTFWPSCEEEIFKLSYDSNIEMKKKLGIPYTSHVVFYPGNMHVSNVDDISALYKAVELVNKEGKNLFLLRTGINYVKFNYGIDSVLPYFIDLGDQPAKKNLEYLSISDILIQPSFENTFNKYRFPSKLPMFLASGRPVITSNTNIGKNLTDWENCIKFVYGDYEELAHKLMLLIESKDLSRKIGQKGRSFAKNNFSWKKSSERIIQFIKKLTGF